MSNILHYGFRAKKKKSINKKFNASKHVNYVAYKELCAELNFFYTHGHNLNVIIPMTFMHDLYIYTVYEICFNYELKLVDIGEWC